MVLLCAMTMADCSELKESIADAQRLLQYASIKGIEVPPDLLAQIVGAQALSSTEPEDPATFKGQDFAFLLDVGQGHAIRNGAYQ